MTTNTRITLLEKLSILPLVCGALASTLFRLTTAVFRTGPKANRPLKDAAFAGMRYLFDKITVAQEQYLKGTKTTLNAYISHTKKTSLEPEVTELESGLKLCWIGPQHAAKVLLYFHGGGYVASASPGHFLWAEELQKKCSKHTNFSIVFAAYTLATPSNGQYPVQLQEAAEALHWLVETRKMNPADIMIGGDSAGGHLCISLLSHLVHPHPEAVKINLKQPLQSAILISPWVSFRVDDASYERNRYCDLLTPAPLARWSSMYRGRSAPDNYNEPIRADAEWFSGLDDVVKDMLIWGGDAEVFIDSIRTFVKTVESVHPNAKCVIQHGAAHADPVIDLLLGYAEHESEPVFTGWIAERI